jgi:NADPH:quinone reductase-like Zn-dependent oxidoreductase
MRGVLLYEYGDAGELRYEETERPDYGDNEVLVRVKATSANPVDFKIRSGSVIARMPVEFPAIVERDLAGEMVNFPKKKRTASSPFPWPA